MQATSPVFLGIGVAVGALLFVGWAARWLFRKGRKDPFFARAPWLEVVLYSSTPLGPEILKGEPWRNLGTEVMVCVGMGAFAFTFWLVGYVVGKRARHVAICNYRDSLR